MKDKFIRTLSPFTVVTVAAYDAAAIGYLIFAIKKIRQGTDGWGIVFAIIMVLAMALAVALTRNVLCTGVRLNSDKVIFNTVDDNNEFRYDEIERVEAQRDEAASLRKNFVDRYSVVILYLSDGSVVTLELGLTTRRRLATIKDEIEKRI